MPDHDRPLNARGAREAQVMARSLRERLETVDLALVSTAQRAQQTWAALREVWDAVTIEQRSELYLASAASLLTQVKELPTTAAAVALIGHNEGMEELATQLSGVPVTMKTSTFAVLTSEADWAQWSIGSAALAEVVVAR